jgi:RNA polymerase sigma-70 factor (ECF subfamily)
MKATEEEEGGIVTRAQAGDKAAFELLYRQNVSRVYAVCLRIVADVPLAEELTQTAFVRAWEMLKTFRGESKFSSWLHRVAVNVVLIDLRSRRRRSASVEPDGDVEQIAGAPSPHSAETAIDLERAIAHLPTQARTILVLHDIEGYQHEEIAILLDIVPGTSKSQLHRAHKLLKGWLGE